MIGNLKKRDTNFTRAIFFSASPSSKGAKPKHLQQQNLPSIPAFTRPSPIGAEVETALNTHRLATNTINEHEDLSSDHNIAAGTLSDDQGWDDWDTDHGGAESLAGDGIDDQEDAKDVIDLSRQPHMIHGQLQLEQNLSDFKKALNEATNRELDKILSKAHVKIEPKSKAPIPDPEPDFFADMEPVIKTNVIQLDEAFEPELKKSGSPSHEKLKKKELFENSHAKENPKTSITKSLIEPKLPEVQGKEGAEISKDELKNVEKDVDDKSGSSPVITSSRLGVASVGAHDEDILEADEDGGGGWGDEDVIFDDPTSGTEDLALED